MISDHIGIDFHGVISQNPDFFRRFNAILANHKMEIHIVSGGLSKNIRQYLAVERIIYHKLWCITDYYAPLGLISYDEVGRFYMDDELWDKAKAKYCAENQIAIMIDDSKIYGQSFITPYCRYDSKCQKGYLTNNKIIDFSASPEQVWTDLRAALI